MPISLQHSIFYVHMVLYLYLAVDNDATDIPWQNWKLDFAGNIACVCIHEGIVTQDADLSGKEAKQTQE